MQFFEGKELQLGLKRLLVGIVVANLISSTIGNLMPIFYNMLLDFALSVRLSGRYIYHFSLNTLNMSTCSNLVSWSAIRIHVIQILKRYVCG